MQLYPVLQAKLRLHVEIARATASHYCLCSERSVKPRLLTDGHINFNSITENDVLLLAMRGIMLLVIDEVLSSN